MDMNAAFPSEYLKASDLRHTNTTVVCDQVAMRTMVDGKEKPVLFFQGTTKGLVLNKINTSVLSDLFGPESDNWHGCEVTLTREMTEFQGKRVACIRVHPSTKKQQIEQREVDETDYSESPF